MKTTKQFHVYYIDNSQAKIKHFATQKLADAFIDSFDTDIDNGNWVEFVFKGSVLKTFKDITANKESGAV